MKKQQKNNNRHAGYAMRPICSKEKQERKNVTSNYHSMVPKVLNDLKMENNNKNVGKREWSP